MSKKEATPRIRLNAQEYEIIQKLREGELTPKEATERQLSGLAETVHKTLKRGGEKFKPTFEELADKLDVSPKKVRAAVNELKAAGYTVQDIAGRAIFSVTIPKRPDFVVNTKSERIY